MSTNRRASKIDRCEKCLINYRLCFCEYLTPKNIETPVQVIMHICESNLTSNTVNLLKQVHDNCHIYYRGSKDSKVDYKTLLKEETHTPLYLFPDKDSVVLTPDLINRLEKPINLIVPDGSWGQAKKFKKRIPELATIQSVTIPSGESSKYVLRTPPADGMLSTFEAMARTLGIIEGSKIQTELEEIFDIMMKRTLMGRAGGV